MIDIELEVLIHQTINKAAGSFSLAGCPQQDLLFLAYLLCVHAKSLQLCPTLCNPMDCSLEGSSVHGIFQVRTLDWVAISFFRVFSNPGIKPMSLMSPALAGRSFTPNTTWEAHLLVTRSAFDVRTRSKSRVFIFLFLESNSISLLDHGDQFT